MFTGIISDIGSLGERQQTGDGARFAIDCAYDPAGIEVGASIACAGVCLTVTTIGQVGNRARFTADVSAETLGCTTAGSWTPGTRINLERALRAGDELGGHLVSGHVDGVATIVERSETASMTVLRLAPPEALLPFIAPKGSVALDGTSLTVNEADDTFTVALIPHTLAATTWGERRPGDRVNIEIDTLARYVARLAGTRGGASV